MHADLASWAAIENMLSIAEHVLVDYALRKVTLDAIPLVQLILYLKAPNANSLTTGITYISQCAGHPIAEVRHTVAAFLHQKDLLSGDVNALTTLVFQTMENLCRQLWNSRSSEQ